MAKYKFFLSTGYVGSKCEDVIEIPDEELYGLNEEEKDKYIYETYFRDWKDNNLDYGWGEVD